LFEKMTAIGFKADSVPANYAISFDRTICKTLNLNDLSIISKTVRQKTNRHTQRARIIAEQRLFSNPQHPV
jgi:hypothetical protein